MTNNNYTTEYNEIISLIAKKLKLNYVEGDKVYKLIRSRIDQLLADMLGVNIIAVWRYRTRGLTANAYLLMKTRREEIIENVIKGLM